MSPTYPPPNARPGREHERAQIRRGVARDVLLAIVDRAPMGDLIAKPAEYAQLAVKLTDALLDRLESDRPPHVAGRGQ